MSKEMEINNKTQMYRLFEQGRFGNRTETYQTVDEVLEAWKDFCCSSVGIRHRYDRSFKTVYHVWPEYLKATVDNLILHCKVEDESHLHYSQMAPDEYIIWQGEVQHNWSLNPKWCGLTGLVSTIQKPMKQALAEERMHMRGLQLRELIKTTLCPGSQSDLEELLDDFPGHAIELSVYSRNVGCLPSRNTIFWEVRNY